MINSIQRLCCALLFTLTVLSYFIILPVNVNLIISATSIIYIGSTLSLQLQRTRKARGEKNEDVMSTADAYLFPFIGSALLLSLYILFKFFGREYVNMAMAAYFVILATGALTANLDPLVRALFFKPTQFHLKKAIMVPFMGPYHLDLTASKMVSGVFASMVALAWFQTRHFILNNIFGISFSITGIESMSVGNYKVGCILLCGLFFYDIFWVFGTDVMVTVATGFDAPIKLLFPREFATDEAKGKFSMLGLGDIVVPGIFIALLLRFDAHRGNNKDNFPKTFFHINLLFYVLGLLTTVLVMYAFNAAQPALLYLVPACLGASAATAFYCGEMPALLAYSEEEEDVKKET